MLLTCAEHFDCWSQIILSITKKWTCTPQSCWLNYTEKALTIVTFDYKCRSGQCWPKVGTIAVALDQRWPNFLSGIKLGKSSQEWESIYFGNEKPQFLHVSALSHAVGSPETRECPVINSLLKCSAPDLCDLKCQDELTNDGGLQREAGLFSGHQWPIHVVQSIWERILHHLQLVKKNVSSLPTMGFQFNHFPCDDWDNIYTLSYYHHHHQIGSMNFYPLFRVRS